MQVKTLLNQQNSAEMAMLCQHAYNTNASEILKQLKASDDRFQNVTAFDNNYSQAIFVTHTDYIAIIFRGSDELGDWLDNFHIASERTDIGIFHAGFRHATHNIWQEIFSHYKNTDSQRPLFIGGHSLGGAMSIIAAAELQAAGHHVSAIYTFGQPRVMSPTTAKNFAADFHNRYFRFRNNNDPVPRVPFPFRFRHAGTCIYITAKNKITINPGRYFRAWDAVRGIKYASRTVIKKGFCPAMLVADHNMSGYLKAVRDCPEFPSR